MKVRDRRVIYFDTLAKISLDRKKAMERRAKAFVAAFICYFFAASVAFAAGDAESGRDLARRWCTGCHLVDQSGKGPDTAPPFTAIARRHASDHSWLRVWLGNPHPPMPNFNLSRQEIDDIVAYLDSLAPH